MINLKKIYIFTFLSAVLALGQSQRHFFNKVTWPKFFLNFEFLAWVKKWHFGNFSERAEMAVPC